MRTTNSIRRFVPLFVIALATAAFAQQADTPTREPQRRSIQRSPRGNIRDAEKRNQQGAERERRSLRDRENTGSGRIIRRSGGAEGDGQPATRDQRPGTDGRSITRDGRTGTDGRAAVRDRNGAVNRDRALQRGGNRARQLPYRPDPRVQRRGVDRGRIRDGRTGRIAGRATGRRYLSPGTRVTRLPRAHQRVRFNNRDFYRFGDSFYVREVGPFGERYIVSRPPLGSYLRSLPPGANFVNVGGVRYYTFNDVYYLPSVIDSVLQYLVVDAPLGGFLTTLPGQYEVVQRRGRRLYRVGNVFYQPEYRGNNLVYVRVQDFDPEPALLFGTLSYRGRLALPSDASAHVRLLELTGRDQARLVAEDRIINAGQAPIPYRLRFDKLDRRAGRYAIEAEITANGRKMYATAERFVLPAGQRSDGIDLVLEPVRDRGPIYQQARITGTINYEARVAVPRNATVDIRLVDWNTPQGAQVLTETTVPFTGTPMRFELFYDPAQIDPLGIYVVDAEIRDVTGNAVLFNRESFRVLTRGHDDNVDLWLDPTY